MAHWCHNRQGIYYCVVKNHHRPLRTAAEVGSDPTKFEDFVQRCSATAEQPDMYTVDKIVDVRVTSGEVEYRVKWRGLNIESMHFSDFDFE